MPYQSRWSVDLPNCSLPTFLLKSPTHPLGNKKCWIDATRPETHYFTRDEFRLWSQRFALGLTRSRHFKPGDRILLFSRNDLFIPVVFMGTLCAGGIYSGANPTYNSRELAHQLRDSGATYLLCSESSIDTGIEAAKMVGLNPTDRVFLFNSDIFDGHSSGLKGCRYWSELVAPIEDAKSYQWPELTGPGECHKTLALNYSSGTTGVAKGVEITHKNYVANTLQATYNTSKAPGYAERMARAALLGFLPLYHAYGQTHLIVSSFYSQIPVYVMPKWELVAMLEGIQRFRITNLTLVPPIAVAIAKSPVVERYDLSSIEVVGCGAAPLSREISEQVERKLGNRINLRQGWGMTECTCSLLKWDASMKALTSGVGEPIANCSAKIMTEEGDHEIISRGPEHRGELWCRGPNIMKGYWNNPKATAETLTPDGWLKTGDIAYMDHDGIFHVVDRKKELIKVKGLQVAPAELEALLLEHDGIAEAAVIGMPTPEGDENPRAFVIRQPNDAGARLTEAQVKAYLAGKVSRYKQLAGGVQFVESIPKNPSGKILRRVLRDSVKEDSKLYQAKL